MNEIQSNQILEAMVKATGPDQTSHDVKHFSIDGKTPHAVVSPKDIGQLKDVVSTAYNLNLSVAPWGGGTKIDIGNIINKLDVVIKMSKLNKITRLNPDDLTATVEAGITLDSLQKALSKVGQFLPLDSPLSAKATIGGTLAIGTNGLIKWHYGNPRDLVIGMQVVQANGKLSNSGGQVVKNVSGYDMAKLHIGGLGTLGIIGELSIKTTPIPVKTCTVAATFNTAGQCEATGQNIFQSHIKPMALIGFNYETNKIAELLNHPSLLNSKYTLVIKLGGRALSLDRQIRDCITMCKAQNAQFSVTQLDDESLWKKLADFGSDNMMAPFISLRTNIPPARMVDLTKTLTSLFNEQYMRLSIVSHPGYGTLLLNLFNDGPVVSIQRTVEILNLFKESINQTGGHMIIERCPLEIKSHFDIWDYSHDSLSIMRGLKNQYDPKNTLNPGRFVGGI